MSHDPLVLYGYFRSTAAYRVRIALNLKGLTHDLRYVHLGGEQFDPGYRRLNPQGLVPTLEHGDFRLTQSLAIIEYLDEIFPDIPMLPDDPQMRARARSFCNVIACDTHPLNNLRVLQFLESRLNITKNDRLEWYRHWVAEGLESCEALAKDAPAGRHLFGESPGIADCVLSAQIFNAQRFSCPLEAYPLLMKYHESAMKLPAFKKAHPANQADAEG